MKTGRSLSDIARELERQVESKRDYVAPTGHLQVEVRRPDDAPAFPVLRVGDKGTLPLTAWAHGQVAEGVGIPKPYYDRMLREQPRLLAENVNTWLHAKPERRMVRTLDGRVRAFVSDRFRPLDNIDLAEAALPVLREAGAQVVSSELTETRLYIKATIPSMTGQILLKNLREMTVAERGHRFIEEVISMGVVIRNSEVGHGAVAVEFMAEILRCTNLLISDKMLRRFHVGKQTGTGDDIEEYLTDETRRLDDRAFWSKFGDVLRGSFRRETFDRFIQKAQGAAEAPIAAALDDVVEVTAKKYGLLEDERKGILGHLAAGGDLSQWGLAMAVTRQAQDADDYQRATDLERLGGVIVDLPRTEWRVLGEAKPTKADEKVAVPA